MLFTIDHTTEYRFTRPVFFEPHQIRLEARSDASQRLLRFDLEIEPAPAGVSRALDAEGNVVTLAWFNDLHDRMLLRAHSEVETLRDNPFDFLLTPANHRLPVSYPAWETAPLTATLRRDRGRAKASGPPSRSDPVLSLAHHLRNASNDELVPFLSRLAASIAERFTVIHRETGDPWPPATTIEMGQGACRDLAVLFIDACRAVGLAARFVSGYQQGDTDQDERHMHAWAEVYLPGAGWRGYDPTHGLATADTHVAVAAAADPIHAAPVSATFRGANVGVELTAEVHIETDAPVAV